METKHCKICSTDKKPSEFHKHPKTADGLQPRCKACMRDARNYRTVRNRRFVRKYLSAKCCKDCGNSDSRVLEFDHVSGQKENTVSVLMLHGYSLKRIKAEIRKCEIRCANCHRIRHYEEGY